MSEHAVSICNMAVMFGNISLPLQFTFLNLIKRDESCQFGESAGCLSTLSRSVIWQLCSEILAYRHGSPFFIRSNVMKVARSVKVALCRLILESGPLRVVHLSRHKWPGVLVN